MMGQVNHPNRAVLCQLRGLPQHLPAGLPRSMQQDQGRLTATAKAVGVKLAEIRTQIGSAEICRRVRFDQRTCVCRRKGLRRDLLFQGVCLNTVARIETSASIMDGDAFRQRPCL